MVIIIAHQEEMLADIADHHLPIDMIDGGAYIKYPQYTDVPNDLNIDNTVKKRAVAAVPRKTKETQQDRDKKYELSIISAKVANKIEPVYTEYCSLEQDLITGTTCNACKKELSASSMRAHKSSMSHKDAVIALLYDKNESM